VRSINESSNTRGSREQWTAIPVFERFEPSMLGCAEFGSMIVYWDRNRNRAIRLSGYVVLVGNSPASLTPLTPRANSWDALGDQCFGTFFSAADALRVQPNSPGSFGSSLELADRVELGLFSGHEASSGRRATQN